MKIQLDIPNAGLLIQIANQYPISIAISNWPVLNLELHHTPRALPKN